MITDIQQKSVSGGFLILANMMPVEEAADYCGFFIRDSDPSKKTATNADLLIERGNKNLARSASIPLDNQWSKNFHFEGKGNRKADGQACSGKSSADRSLPEYQDRRYAFYRRTGGKRY